MTAPTPREVFGPTAGTDVDGGGVFSPTSPWVARPGPSQRRRAAAVRSAHERAEQLARALGPLMRRDESDVDLHLELYRRAADRLDVALDELDAALAAGPPLPAPRAR
ncbi:hypothetical protein [Cellulomonas uda]|uniref:Uncharacterized protein n=1 Tax=Cellulomonas uda TaxID=1714 RepID=A0A4Y3K609_CELUD|nr:hypothetical protein [Cellulomonas uda]NII67792.1 hypothetical protein [Cellulomonas uda]GEA79961.1 hypothetical protein CUD01_04050 [Cellulomonas uda]